jgi:conjugative transfer signal peptidase TraF
VSATALLGVAVGIGLMLFSDFAGQHPLLIWNASPSQPVGLYRVERRRARVGDRVLVRLPPRFAAFAARRSYLARKAYLLKPVAAVSGDRVCRWGAQVSVRGRRAARARWQDGLGRDLPVWQGCHRLTPGELFLLAADADSFDSRYFGAVSRDAVSARAVLIWAFK